MIETAPPTVSELDFPAAIVIAPGILLLSPVEMLIAPVGE